MSVIIKYLSVRLDINQMLRTTMYYIQSPCVLSRNNDVI